jgi:hypothetical protein
MLESSSGLGALGRERILVLRYPPELSKRDCEMLDDHGNLVGSVVRVESEPEPKPTRSRRVGRFGLALLRGQTFEIRDRARRCVRRIEGPRAGHESELVVTDARGVEAGTIKDPEVLGFFDRVVLGVGLGRKKYTLEAQGRPLGALTAWSARTSYGSSGGRIYDTSGDQVASIWMRPSPPWRSTDYMIMLRQPLHEALRVLAIAASVYIVTKNRAPLIAPRST